MINEQPKINKNSKKKIIIIVLMALVLVGTGTYALLTGIKITNSEYSYHTACFNVYYDITNDDGTMDITGTLMPGIDYTEGLNGQVSIGLDPSCGITGTGNLYLNLNNVGGASTAIKTVDAHCENPNSLETITDYTDETSCAASSNVWVTNGSALKYAVYDRNNKMIVSVGYVNKVDKKINIYKNFDVSKLVEFDIYVWLDGNLVDNSYLNLSLKGNISADVTQSGGNKVNVVSKPVLDSGMIPVKIANDGTVTTVAETDPNWYNYDNKEWANVVLVDSDSRSTYKGTTDLIVNQDDILAYYVWIPRYKYKIWDVTGTSSPKTINIEFESETAESVFGTNIGSWRTHPAFIWDDDILPGIWVGKFEATGDGTTPTVLPNSTSLTDQNVSTQFQTSLKFAGGTLSNGIVSFAGNNTYGLTTNADSHMMKNSEWGAVAYLSHSLYGINEEIRINNYWDSNGPKTGCGASELNAEYVNVCQIAYGGSSNYPQSTTGNISGVFDMSGGTWEYMMSVLADDSGNPRSGNSLDRNSGFSGLLSDDLDAYGIAFPIAKYYDLYTSVSPLTACNGGICYGHALSETSMWYNDSTAFVRSVYPWLIRSGNAGNGEWTGPFSSNGDGGGAISSYSWRSVLINKVVNTNEVYIKYNANGGTGSMGNTVCTNDQNCSFTANTFTRTGYTFTGWNTKEDGTGTSYDPGATYSANINLTLYAQWRKNRVYIQFDSEDGIVTDATTLEGINYTWITDSNGIISRSANSGDYNDKWFYVDYESSRNLPDYNNANYINVNKTGYAAVSGAEWKCLSGCSTSGATFDHLLDYSSDAFCDASNEDCTVVLGVNWAANTYAVTFDYQSGSGGTSSTAATYASPMPAITNPSRTGYTFGGYYTAASCSGTQYYTSAGASAKNWDKTETITLYACWTANTYTISFDQQGGSDGSSMRTATYASAMPAIAVPSRTSYTFKGYYTAASCSGTQYYTSTGASAKNWDKTEDTTLYACWERVYSNTWVDGKTGSYEISPSTVGGSAKILLKIFWKESYNEYLNQSKLSVTNIQAKMTSTSSSHLNVYFLGGSAAASSTDRGVYINGVRKYAMSYNTGGYKVNLGTANTYKSITVSNAFPWTSAAISHAIDGTLTVPIRVYLEAVHQTSPSSYYSRFNNTTNITLTDLRE